jgi:hypothetical protein
LSYEIVKGFESGINFSFDEDIRFAIFEIVTPSNYNPGLSIAVLTITPYEPTVTVDCDATGDVGAVTIASFEPSCTITLAPSVTLSSVEYISPATVGSNLYAFVHYANPGDSISGTLDWRIIDSELNVVDSGTTGAYNFATTADATVTISGLTYTSPAGIYYIEVKKSADVWTSAVSYSFTSL